MTRSKLLAPASSLAPLLLAGSVLLLAACGGPLEPGPAARPQPASPGLAAGPSRAAAALAAPSAAICTGTGAHGAHLGAGIDCASCHPCGGQYGFDNAVTYPGGTTSAGGTITLATATTPTTCMVGCHSPLGSPPTVVAWAAPGPLACTGCHAVGSLVPTHPPVSPSATRADCQACHDTSRHTSGTVTLAPHPASWMVQTDPGFHAYSADRGLQPCQQCHRQDLSGGVTGFSCAQCHDTQDASGATIGWKTNCTMCHGGADNATGAPPKAIWGYASEAVRVGAHTRHVAGSAMAPPFDCNVCHVKPLDALADGHIDLVTGGAVPTAAVTFGDIALPRGAGAPVPAWDRPSARCSNTYCHGATLSGGSLTTPTWTTLDGTQAACGTCHGVPPPPPHPSILGSPPGACGPCHAQTIDTASGAFVPPSQGGKHLDGAVQATVTHDPSWMDQSSTGFHAYSANRGISACTYCHGADLSGDWTLVACSSCHRAGGVASDFATCVACHGGTSNSTGAPPRATWGSTDPMAIGAHTSHVAGLHRLALPLDCSSCHLKPQSVVSGGHVDGKVGVTGYTGSDPKLLASVKDPGFNAGTGTCATSYCHGATLPDGTNRTPLWTKVDGTQAACGTCHGNPPGTGRHSMHALSFGIPCWACHPGTWIQQYDRGRHLNGGTDLNPNGSSYGTFANWSPTAAGAGTLRGTASGCHGGSYYWNGSPPAPRTGCY